MRPALYSGDALPIGILAPCNLGWNQLSCEGSLLCGELALPFRVARVSRLIGKSDTTAN